MRYWGGRQDSSANREEGWTGIRYPSFSEPGISWLPCHQSISSKTAAVFQISNRQPSSIQNLILERDGQTPPCSPQTPSEFCKNPRMVSPNPLRKQRKNLPLQGGKQKQEAARLLVNRPASPPVLLQKLIDASGHAHRNLSINITREWCV